MLHILDAKYILYYDKVCFEAIFYIAYGNYNYLNSILFGGQRITIIDEWRQLCFISC